MQGPDLKGTRCLGHELHAQSSRGAAPQGRALLRAPRLPGVRLSDDEVAPARPVRTELTADQTLLPTSTLAGVERPSSRERRRPPRRRHRGAPFAAAQHRAAHRGCDAAGPRASLEPGEHARQFTLHTTNVPFSPSLQPQFGSSGRSSGTSARSSTGNAGLAMCCGAAACFSSSWGGSSILCRIGCCRRASRSRWACLTRLPPLQQTVGASQMILPRVGSDVAHEEHIPKSLVVGQCSLQWCGADAVISTSVLSPLKTRTRAVTRRRPSPHRSRNH